MTAACRFCGNHVDQPRWDAGYEWCRAPLCVDKGLHPSRAAFALVCNHKSNYEPMRVATVATLAGNPQGRR